MYIFFKTKQKFGSDYLYKLSDDMLYVIHSYSRYPGFNKNYNVMNTGKKFWSDISSNIVEDLHKDWDINIITDDEAFLELL